MLYFDSNKASVDDTFLREHQHYVPARPTLVGAEGPTIQLHELVVPYGYFHVPRYKYLFPSGLEALTLFIEDRGYCLAQVTRAFETACADKRIDCLVVPRADNVLAERMDTVFGTAFWYVTAIPFRKVGPR